MAAEPGVRLPAYAIEVAAEDTGARRLQRRASGTEPRTGTSRTLSAPVATSKPGEAAARPPPLAVRKAPAAKTRPSATASARGRRRRCRRSTPPAARRDLRVDGGEVVDLRARRARELPARDEPAGRDRERVDIIVGIGVEDPGSNRARGHVDGRESVARLLVDLRELAADVELRADHRERVGVLVEEQPERLARLARQRVQRRDGVVERAGDLGEVAGHEQPCAVGGEVVDVAVGRGAEGGVELRR